jgi:hypothetical protein
MFARGLGGLGMEWRWEMDTGGKESRMFMRRFSLPRIG